MQKISAIIEARSNSTRLPKKILLKINNKTIIEYLVNNLKKSKIINEIIIATTTNKEDDKIVKIAKKLKVNYFRGSEKNVLKRVIDASKFFKVKTIVRVTSDCPLIDVNLVDQYINIFKKNKFDIVGNAKVRSYPDGMDIEIINSQSLKKSYKFAKSNYLREHICLTIYQKKRLFQTCNIVALANEFFPNLSLTLDEYKDFVLIEKIIKHYDKTKKDLNCSDIIKLVYKNKWQKINNSVKKLKHKVYDYQNNN